MPELSGLIVLMEGEGGAPVLRLQLGTPAAEVDLAAWQGRLDACGVRAECRTAEDLVCFTLFLPSKNAISSSFPHSQQNTRSPTVRSLSCVHAIVIHRPFLYPSKIHSLF